MNKKLTLPFALLLFTVTAIAQPQPVGHLTIFSEDGDKFFLILNGERQNNVAQTNLRVEDLPQPYYSAKIIFEDKSLADISKNIQIADVDGRLSDVTYKLKRDKNNGKMALRYYSAIPVQQGFVAPSNVAVVHFGNPVVQPTTVVTTTTPVVTQTTTTTTTSNVGVGASVNVGGIGMNVTINDPLLNGEVQTNTTTSRTTTVNSTAVVEPPRQPVGCANAYAMSSSDFSNALATIKKQGFSDTQLKTAKQVASANCLSVSQITQICQIFGFEETKLDFAKFAYDRCTEPRNYFNVNNVFGFSSSSDELNDYVQGRQ
ncbi:MAG: DUF4476 domain-containing protein [Bacteroidetes bacterium]|nr:DUF4476 domain-containing protein [Bacteroidota bacterium]